MREIWRDISGYEGSYQVSNFGRVKSLFRSKIITSIKRTCLIHYKGKIKNLTPDTKGYVRVRLSDGRYNQKTFKVHRLVALAFISNPFKKSDINHKDCNKVNNHVKNLEWCTKIENIKHARQHGRFQRPKCENNHNAKLSNKQVKSIKKYLEKNKWGLVTQLAKQYHVSRNTISDIKHNRSWITLR
jgi:hypothetical protein